MTIYQLYQAQQDLAEPARLAAAAMLDWARWLWPGESEWAPVRRAVLRAVAAGAELVTGAATTHRRPSFGIGKVDIGNREVAVEEEAVLSTPFGTLLRFRKDIAAEQPRVLVVAPMSGHFATLLRGTVRTMLPEHDVYITDWHNARDIPLSAGHFGFDEFVEHVIRFQEAIGPGGHVVAVCQPTVPVLAAVALMAEDRNPAQPRSMALMAGPIDTRLSPTKVNELARARPIEWFRRNLIGTVPLRYPGAMRRVYPGFMQLTAFISMNLERHVGAHAAQFRNLLSGEEERAAAHRNFYDEYLAVMDLPAEFYLETVERIFQRHALARGELLWRGRKVQPRHIRRTALLTVEGELDDICGIGQTMAALDLCEGLPTSMRQHHLQTGVGHYGVFNGRRWQGGIYPVVREMIQSTS
jgi:poly(3-hydroxybutyrate) depolymerase